MELIAANKYLIAIIISVLTLFSYLPYFRDILRGTTKPHAISWFIWAMLTAVGFAGQVSDGAGAGSFVTGVSALCCLVISFVGWRYGERDIRNPDWACLGFAVAAVPLWVVTDSPLWSVILVTIIDAVGFFPTFRKSFSKPGEETLFTYGWSGAKFFISLLILDRYTLVTTLYPLSLVLMNGLFVLMVLLRRRQLHPPGQIPSEIRPIA